LMRKVRAAEAGALGASRLLRVLSTRVSSFLRHMLSPDGDSL
jgi:hypothetical protein